MRKLVASEARTLLANTLLTHLCAVFTVVMQREFTFVVFTLSCIINLVHGRLFQFPLALKHLEHALSALERLDAFLSRPELPPALPPLPPTLGEGSDKTSSIHVQGASFAWVAPAPLLQDHALLALRDVNLSVRPGELVVIVGGPSSGKSSLLLSLLGETARLSGSAFVDTLSAQAIAAKPPGWPAESIAYAPQVPWIVAGATLRENVVMGRPWDAPRYAAALAATALGIDLSGLPLGDLTPVSTGTLSGGQAQRVSLARVAYSRAPIVILDDCLAALDSRVASAVFRECILGLLAGRTRVLVSRSSEAVAASDVIGVLLRPPGAGAASLVSGPTATLLAIPEVATVVDAVTGLPRELDEPGGDRGSLGAFGAAARGPLTPAAAAKDPAAGDKEAVGVSAAALLDEAAAHSSKSNGDGPARLPFFVLWEAGIGGAGYAAAFLVSIIVELSIYIVYHWWIMQWTYAGNHAATFHGASGSALWKRAVTIPEASTDFYLGITGLVVVLQSGIAIARQFVLAEGIAAANDALHGALLFRLQHAQQGALDRIPRPRLLGWFGALLFQLDVHTYDSSEFFWMYALFLGEILIGEGWLAGGCYATLSSFTRPPAALQPTSSLSHGCLCRRLWLSRSSF